MGFPWLKNEGPAVVALHIGLIARPDALNLRLHPVLHLRNGDEPIRDLERLELTDDLGSLHVLVEVDDRDSVLARFTRELARGAIANVDERQVGEVDADEWDAGSDVILQTLAKHCIVSPDVSDGLQLIQPSLGLSRHQLPSPLQAVDHRRVERADNRHQ